MYKQFENTQVLFKLKIIVFHSSKIFKKKSYQIPMTTKHC